MPNTVVLYSEDPSFFERPDTHIARRGVDVFATMDIFELGAVISAAPVKLVISRGAPGGMPEPSLRSRLGTSPHVLILGSDADDPMTLKTYQAGIGSTVLLEPYQNRVFETTQKLLEVPIRHYVRMLVQMKGSGDSSTAGAGFSYCQNVSVSGMLIEAKKELVVGSTVRLSFMVPNVPGMIDVSARVVRHASSVKDAHRYGVHFLDLRPEDKEKIAGLGEPRPPTRSASSPGRALRSPSGAYL